MLKGITDAKVSSGAGAKMVRLERPKYKEEFSLRECELFQPWRVDLHIARDRYDEEGIMYTIFIRADVPWSAQWGSAAFFDAFERKGPGGRKLEYPDVFTIDKNDDPSKSKSVARKIDEKEWEMELKLAEHQPSFKFAGMRDNPTIFSWDIDPNICRNKNTGIIERPGNLMVDIPASLVNKINSTKDRK